MCDVPAKVSVWSDIIIGDIQNKVILRSFARGLSSREEQKKSNISDWNKNNILN